MIDPPAERIHVPPLWAVSLVVVSRLTFLNENTVDIHAHELVPSIVIPRKHLKSDFITAEVSFDSFTEVAISTLTPKHCLVGCTCTPKTAEFST